MDKADVAHISRMLEKSRLVVWTLEERLERVRALQHLLRDNRQSLVAAIEADFGGRGHPWTTVVDIGGGLNTAREVVMNLKDWMEPEYVGAAFPFNLAGDAYCIYQPIGVVLCVTPWNFPVHLAMSALADLLGSGNRVVLKPSEHAPRSSNLLRDLISKYFDPLDVSVICGDSDVAQELTAMKFDHIMFTGSPTVGKMVMRAASDNLTPLTLELGGKNPCLIAPDYDLEHAAHEICDFKAANAGQMCTCVDYVLVPKGRANEFAKACMKRVAHRWGSSMPLVEHPQYCSMINTTHANRVMSILRDATQKGASVRCLCPHGKQRRENKIALALVLPPFQKSMRVFTEEVFGPVMAVVEYSTVDEAVAYINARERPLAFYAFTDSSATKDLLLYRIVSGGVTINALNTHAVIQALPFGGVGHSGFGAYHGIDGFRNFSHKKSVFVAKRGFFLPNLLPPFSNFDLKIVEAALKEPPKFKKIAYAALACFLLYIAHRNGAPAAVYSALVKCIKYSCSILFRLPKA
jgi:coniferyl-aldehyde dehydrogenase